MPSSNGAGGSQVKGGGEGVHCPRRSVPASLRGLGCARGVPPPPRGALEEKGPQRQSDRRLEEVAKAVGGGYCRLRMPLKLALGVRGAVAGHRLDALERRGGWYLVQPDGMSHRGGTSPFQCIPGLLHPPSHSQ